MMNAVGTSPVLHSAFSIQHSPFNIHRFLPGESEDFERVLALPTRPSSLPFQPSPRKPRPLQSRDDVRILPHRLPNQAAAIVLDHGQDRPFVDAEVIDVEPTLLGNDAAVLELPDRP